MKRAALVGAALVAGVLGYGAWRAHTQATLWLAVHDHGGRNDSRLWVDAVDARLTVRDAAGAPLAEIELVPPHGLPRYGGGAGAVDCNAFERAGGAAWRDCFEAQSRWIARWAPRATSARIAIGGCTIDPVPVVRRSGGDWWLWWVPLPHVGGTPRGHHRLELHVDSARCAAVTAP